MNALVIVLVVVVVLGVIALIAFNPMLKKREDAAIAVMRERFGDNERLLVEPRATAMGTEPDEAGGVRGMSVLAVNTDAAARGDVVRPARVQRRPLGDHRRSSRPPTIPRPCRRPPSS